MASLLTVDIFFFVLINYAFLEVVVILRELEPLYEGIIIFGLSAPVELGIMVEVVV